MTTRLQDAFGTAPGFDASGTTKILASARLICWTKGDLRGERGGCPSAASEQSALAGRGGGGSPRGRPACPACGRRRARGAPPPPRPPPPSPSADRLGAYFVAGAVAWRRR